MLSLITYFCLSISASLSTSVSFLAFPPAAAAVELDVAVDDTVATCSTSEPPEDELDEVEEDLLRLLFLCLLRWCLLCLEESRDLDLDLDDLLPLLPPPLLPPPLLCDLEERSLLLDLDLCLLREDDVGALPVEVVALTADVAGGDLDLEERAISSQRSERSIFRKVQLRRSNQGMAKSGKAKTMQTSAEKCLSSTVVYHVY